MASWKKVVVSGSQAELATLKVDNLTSGQVVIGGGQAANLSTTAINGTGNIVATTGASGLSASGSFSGSFTGQFTGSLSGTATQVANSLTQGSGITSFTYNGSAAQTVAVSGTVGMATNAITKWTGNAFTASTLTDNGTTITGASSIQLTGASSNLSGSFSGSFQGDGSRLTGVTAQATYALTFGEGIGLNAQGSSSYNGNTAVTITVSGAADLTDGRYIKWDNTANKVANSLIYDDGTNLQITGSTIIVSGASTAFVVTGSVRSLGGFTGSLFGTASFVTGTIFIGSNVATSASYALTASYAANGGTLLNSLTPGLGLSGSAFNGSAAQTFFISGAAQLTTNTLPKWTGTGLNNSNITDTGTLITLGTSTVNVSIPGNLNVAGTASFTNTDSLFVADKFIALASGSTTLTQAGIIAIASSTSTGMSGSAFYLDNVGTYGRWALTSSLHATASSATPSDYMVSAIVNQASAPTSQKPNWGADANNTNAGNMWIQTNGDIYIYS